MYISIRNCWIFSENNNAMPKIIAWTTKWKRQLSLHVQLMWEWDLISGFSLHRFLGDQTEHVHLMWEWDLISVHKTPPTMFFSRKLNRDKFIAFSHSLFLPVIYSRQPNRRQLRIFIYFPCFTKSQKQESIIRYCNACKRGWWSLREGCDADTVPFIVSLLVSVLSWIFSFSLSFSYSG